MSDIYKRKKRIDVLSWKKYKKIRTFEQLKTYAAFPNWVWGKVHYLEYKSEFILDDMINTVVKYFCSSMRYRIIDVLLQEYGCDLGVLIRYRGKERVARIYRDNRHDITVEIYDNYPYSTDRTVLYSQKFDKLTLRTSRLVFGAILMKYGLPSSMM